MVAIFDISILVKESKVTFLIPIAVSVLNLGQRVDIVKTAELVVVCI